MYLIVDMLAIVKKKTKKNSSLFLSKHFDQNCLWKSNSLP